MKKLVTKIYYLCPNISGFVVIANTGYLIRDAKERREVNIYQ